MIVLAESNFVLELALQQEEYEHAARILLLAETKKMRLVIPACSLFEPYQTLTRRRSERKELSRKLQDDLKLLGRSQGFAELGAISAQVAQTLDASTEIEREALEQTIDKLLSVCTVTALTKEIVRLGQAVQLVSDLDSHDAIVYASIETALKDLGPAPKVFVNKNSKDFATPLIENQLQTYNCRVITSFLNARQYIENKLSKEGG